MSRPAVRTFGPVGGVPSPPVSPPPTADRRSSSTLRPTLPFDFSRARSTSGASSTASAWLNSFAEGIRGAASSARSDDGSSVIATSPPPVATHIMARKGSHSMTNPFNKAPPPPTHSVSSPQLPRKPPQPSNLSRLSSEADAPRHRPSLSTSSANTSSASLPPIPRSASAQLPTVTRTTSTTRPYKRGFQPAGVKHSRTDEFVAARRMRGADREKEEGRLGKRWLKLVDLHFNPDPPKPLPTSGSSLSLSTTLNNVANPKRALKQIDIKPRDVWRGFKDVAGVNPAAEEVRKRAEEQAIVLWEADGDVKRCRICQSSFTLANRKHHCRICGKIVCSLPPSAFLPPPSVELAPGLRREKCSLLLVADFKTGRGQEVDEGFVGWMKLEGEDAGEAPVKGVRVCRDCWSVVSRKQVIADRQRVVPFSRLYLALRSTQSDISEAMPLYEEEILAFRNGDKDATPELLSMHKEMLGLLAQYDVLTKRIATAPTPSAAQESVQRSIARVATAFLQKAMAAVQDLPRIQLERKRARVKEGSHIVETSLTDLTDDTAAILQPLLEQEAQLETYIAEANARRKFEDAQSLTESLGEIRQEIARLVM